MGVPPDDDVAEPANFHTTGRTAGSAAQSIWSNLNSKVRLLPHRAYGSHSADAMIAMISFCCAGIQIDLPHR